METDLLIFKLINSQKYRNGELVKLSHYLVNQADSKFTVYRQVNKMVADTRVSKMTIIPFLKWLEQTGFIIRIKPSVTILLPQFISVIQKFNTMTTD